MYDVYGVLCETYEEACMVAGIETPAQLAAEEAWYAMLNEVENLRQPVPCDWCHCAGEARKAAYETGIANDEPFPF